MNAEWTNADSISSAQALSHLSTVAEQYDDSKAPAKHRANRHQGTIWLFLGTWILTIPVVASLAEMASMSPSAGGQYAWVSEFAPPSMQKFLSYISGWLAALGWQAFIASSAYTCGSLILVMASTRDSTYTPSVWYVMRGIEERSTNRRTDTSRQTTLMTMAVGVFAICFNSFGARHLPLFEGVILVAFVVGFFVICIPLWVLAPKASSAEVLSNFENFGGWATTGAACVVGQMAASASFIVGDHPSKDLPLALLTRDTNRASTVPLTWPKKSKMRLSPYLA